MVKQHRILGLAMTTTTRTTPTLCMHRPRMPLRIFHRAVGDPLRTKGRHHHPHEAGPAFLIHSGESFNHPEKMGNIIMRYVPVRVVRLEGGARQGSFHECVLSLISVIVPRDLFSSPTILTTTAAITTTPRAAAARVVLAITTTSHPVWLQPPQEGEGFR